MILFVYSCTPNHGLVGIPPQKSKTFSYTNSDRNKISIENKSSVFLDIEIGSQNSENSISQFQLGVNKKVVAQINSTEELLIFNSSDQFADVLIKVNNENLISLDDSDKVFTLE